MLIKAVEILDPYNSQKVESFGDSWTPLPTDCGRPVVHRDTMWQGKAMAVRE